MSMLASEDSYALTGSGKSVLIDVSDNSIYARVTVSCYVVKFLSCLASRHTALARINIFQSNKHLASYSS